jgi:hypothetical protein
MTLRCTMQTRNRRTKAVAGLEMLLAGRVRTTLPCPSRSGKCPSLGCAAALARLFAPVVDYRDAVRVLCSCATPSGKFIVTGPSTDLSNPEWAGMLCLAQLSHSLRAEVSWGQPGRMNAGGLGDDHARRRGSWLQGGHGMGSHSPYAWQSRA